MCVNNKDYSASLELRKLYQVLSDEVTAKSHQLRVIDVTRPVFLYQSKLEFLSYVNTTQGIEIRVTPKRKRPRCFRNVAFI